MLTGISLDIILVLYLELSRNAVDTALSFKLEPIAQAHIAVSTLALILYFPLLYLGYKLSKGEQTKRQIHKKLGITAYSLRTLGFIFMFWVK